MGDINGGQTGMLKTSRLASYAISPFRLDCKRHTATQC